MTALVFAACVTLAPSAARAQSPAAAREALNRIGADLFSTAPNPAKAIEELKAILAADPKNAEAHMLLGIAYRAQATPELMGEAVAELRQALAINPSLLMARFTLARVYLDMARTSRARDELELALEQAPGRPELLSLLGEAERQLANPTRSVELNGQALKADPQFVQARYYLGLALLDLRRHAEAIAELQQVVQSGANPPEAYLALGRAYLDAGQADAAAKALQEAVRLDPRRAETHVQLARAYRTRGQLEAALKELNLARPAGPAGLSVLYQNLEVDLYMEEGLVRLQQGRPDAAARLFQRVLDLDSTHEPAKQQLAIARKRVQAAKKKTPGGLP